MKKLKQFLSQLFTSAIKRINEEEQLIVDDVNEACERQRQMWLNRFKREEAAKIQDRIDKDEEYRRMARIFKEVWEDGV